MLRIIIFSICLLVCVLEARAQQKHYSLILAGDGGYPDKQALKTLNHHAWLNPETTAVFMLGDNIYDFGLPEPEHKYYEKSKTKLQKQIDALKETQAKVVFIPGNHDWDNSGEKGMTYLKNQQLLEQQQLGQGSFLPVNGCPGPVVALETDFFRVIVFDSEWWHFRYKKPDSPAYGCVAHDRPGIAAEFKKITESSDKPVVFLQHHPVISAYYTPDKKDCYFDPDCKKQSELKTFLSAVFRDKPPFLCGFGHDHSLQHLEDKYFCRNHVISGAISSARKTKDRSLARFVHEDLGFIKVDFLENKQIILRAIGTDSKNPAGRLLYETNLKAD